MTYIEQREVLVDMLVRREQLSEATETAIRTVPRHEFVPQSRRGRAYEDTPLPIGAGQTISAPHMVAIMTDLLGLSGTEQVLEIGTGCGYHAAVTAEVVGGENVYSVEYHDDLATNARETLERTGYGDVTVRTGDGKQGLPKFAPYDRIYLTCAADEFPKPLRQQLRDGGILLGPIGARSQTLTKARKTGDSFSRSTHGRVRFVPLK